MYDWPVADGDRNLVFYRFFGHQIIQSSNSVQPCSDATSSLPLLTCGAIIDSISDDVREEVDELTRSQSTVLMVRWAKAQSGFHASKNKFGRPHELYRVFSSVGMLLHYDASIKRVYIRKILLSRFRRQAQQYTIRRAGILLELKLINQFLYFLLDRV